jgi:hypothetical protein
MRNARQRLWPGSPRPSKEFAINGGSASDERELQVALRPGAPLLAVWSKLWQPVSVRNAC